MVKGDHFSHMGGNGLKEICFYAKKILLTAFNPPLLETLAMVICTLEFTYYHNFTERLGLKKKHTSKEKQRKLTHGFLFPSY